MEDYIFYRDNVAILCRYRDEILSNPQEYYSQLPFEIKYSIRGKHVSGEILPVESPIYLGSLIRAWMEYPELFTKKCSSGQCSEGTSYIFWFNGSPLSGNNEYSCVCGDCGAVVQGASDRNFLKRCNALDSILKEDRVRKSFAVDALHIHAVIMKYISIEQEESRCE